MTQGLLSRIAFCVLWLAIAAAGIAAIVRYEKREGAIGETPAKWPSAIFSRTGSNRDTLAMFAHPQCPCTRASLEELNRLLASPHSAVDFHVYFFKPKNASADWARTGLWRAAKELPGVSVHEDVDGETAKLFGAETSGFVVLYDSQGRLLFKGGITGSRGHIGDNSSEQTLAKLLGGKISASAQTPVYGCSISEVASTQKENAQ